MNLSIELSNASFELFLHIHGPLVCFQKEKCTLSTKNIFSFYEEKKGKYTEIIPTLYRDCT